jgi:hypothetical protein
MVADLAGNLKQQLSLPPLELRLNQVQLGLGSGSSSGSLAGSTPRSASGTNRPSGPMAA